MTIQIRLFHHLQIQSGSQVLLLRPRAQRLLAYLLLHRKSHLPRRSLAFNLWPDMPEEEALGTLRRALNDLRAGLADQADCLTATRGEIHWNLSAPYWLDVEAFEMEIQQADAESLRQAVEHYTGDLLRDMDEEWLIAERERYRQLQFEGLRKLSLHYQSLQNYATALEYTRRALLLDPLSELVYQDRIKLLFLAGDRAAALAEYERLQSTLENELGVAPMEETHELAEAIARGESLTGGGYGSPSLIAAQTFQIPPRLVGRAGETAKLSELWEVASLGHGRLVIVSGEAGIGKSHLLRNLAYQASQRGGLPLIGHCYEFENTLPYQPIVELLRPVSHLIRSLALLPNHRAVLAKLLPEAFDQEEVPNVMLSPEDLRSQLFEALLKVFLLLSKNHCVLLIIEDTHWASEFTLDWLTYITPRLAGNRMLVAVTYRTDEIHTQHAVARLARRFERDEIITSIPLPRLSREDNREWVTHLSGLERERAFPVADRIFEETAGNPFFLQEIVRGMIEAGQIQWEAGRWSGAFVQGADEADIPLPDSLRDTILARMGRLTEMARAFLQVAAVAGRSFHYDQVYRAGGWSDETSLGALDDLRARGFLREGDAQGMFVFAHHLMQEAIYSDLTTPRRIFWHRKLAEAMQMLRPNDFETLAYHFSRAGDHARAGSYYVQAGDQAAALYANEDAVHFLEQGLASRVDDLQQIRVRQRLGEIYELIGKRDEAEAHYHQALDLAGRLGNQKAQAECQAALGILTRRKGMYDEALTWLGQARQGFEALDDKQGLSQVMGGMGGVHWSLLNYSLALECFDEQLRLARETGDQRRIGYALGAMGVVYTEQGEYARALECYEQRLQIDLLLDDKLSLAKTIGNIGIVYQDRGEYARALTCYHQLLSVTTELGDRQNTAVAVGNMIKLYTAQNQYGIAEKLARRAIRLGRALDIPLYLSEYLYDAADLFTRLGRYEEARMLNDEALYLAQRIELRNIQFGVSILDIRLQRNLGRIGASDAVSRLETLLDSLTEDWERAAAQFEIWRLDGTRDIERRNAAELYRRLHSTSPNFEYRQRYHHLTGEHLPDPAPLPELPPSVRQNSLTLEALLARVDHMLAELK